MAEIPGESIGVARIDLIADTATFEAEVARAKSQIATLGPAGEASFAKMTASQKSATLAALKFEQSIGKSRDEMRLLSLAARGAAPEAIDKLRQKMIEFRAASDGAALDAARFSDAQLLSANRALAAFSAQSNAAKAAAAAQAETAAADDVRFKKIAADAVAEVEARRAVTVATIDQARANAVLAESQGVSSGARATSAVEVLDAATVKQQVADYAALDAIMGKRVATTEEVLAAERALDRLQKAGLISNDELAESFAALDAATSAETKALKANSIAQVENAGAAKLNSRVQYEIGVLAGEIASGNTSRIKRSIPALLNAAHLTQKLLSPVGLSIVGVIAALALFGKAVADREEDLLDFNKALAATGDFAGTTGLQLQGVAALVGQSTGRYSDATQAVLALAKSGTVLESNMRDIATVAVNMSYLTGESVDKVVKDLITLQGDPTQAIIKLKGAMGLLTTAQYNEIVATQQQQGASQAAALAMKDLGEASDHARENMVNNAGIVIRAWQGVKDFFSDTGKLIGSIGATQSNAELIAIQQARLKMLQDQVRPGNGVSQSPVFQAQLADAKAQIAALQQKEQAATFFDPARQLDAQIKQEHDKDLAAALASDKQGVEGFVAQANDINKKRLLALIGVVDPSIRDRVNAAYDQQIRDAVKRTNAQLPHGGHGSQSHAAENAFAEFQRQVAGLTAKSSDAGNSAVSAYTQGVLKLIAGFDKATKSGKNVTEATALYDQGIKALGADLKAATDKQNAAITAYQNAVDAQTAAQKAQLDAQVASIGMGDREIAQAQAISQIRQQSTDTIRRLTSQRNEALAVNPDADTKVLDAQIEAEKKALDQRLANQQQYYSDVTAAQSNWLNGAVAAFTNFADQAANIAGQTRDVFSTAFGDMTDALTNFVITGKLNFQTFADDIIKGLLRIELQAAESKIFSSVLGAFATGPSGANMGYFGQFSKTATDQTSGSIVDSIIGSRAAGGPVSGGSLYEVAEGGKPETLTVGNHTYLLMGSDPGYVTPASRAGMGAKSSGNGSPIELQINLKNESGQALQAKQQGKATQNGNKIMADFVLTTVAGDVAGGGKTAKAMQQRFGLARAGVPVGA